MGRQIRIKAIPKSEPDIQLYVLALIALARQLQEPAERQPQRPGPVLPPSDQAGAAGG